MNVNRREIKQKLIQQAAKDEAFRRELIANPRQTIEQELGEPLPGDLEVIVVEEAPSNICLVLPPDLSGELSEEELEKVSGGEIQEPHYPRR